MIVWLMIILFLGAAITFFSSFIVEYNLLWCFGAAIMLITAGIGMRISFFRRKGEKEKYLKEIEELKRKLSENQTQDKKE